MKLIGFSPISEARERFFKRLYERLGGRLVAEVPQIGGKLVFYTYNY